MDEESLKSTRITTNNPDFVLHRKQKNPLNLNEDVFLAFTSDFFFGYIMSPI